VATATPLAFLAGCSIHGVAHRGASVGEHLTTPFQQSAERRPAGELTFPLRAAVVFVHDRFPQRRGVNLMKIVDHRLADSTKEMFRRRIVDTLAAHGWIAPTDSMRADVLILLGYDQVQRHTDRWMAPLAVASSIGMLVFALDSSKPQNLPIAGGFTALLALTTILPTLRVQTETVLEAVAYHRRSGRILFRVPATDVRRRRTWMYGTQSVHREQGTKSIEEAFDVLSRALVNRFTVFERRTRQSTDGTPLF
jgi:hypothetical protein